MITVERFETVDEASASVASGGIYYGGGTLVMRAVNYAEAGHDRLVRSTDPALKTIDSNGTGLTLGAGVTMADLMRARETEFLSSAARAVGGPAIRNAATIGGNLFASHPYGDFTTALLSLDAKVNSTIKTDEDIEQFLASRGTHTGIVRSISLQIPERGAFRFKKISRVKPKGISIMSIAICLPQSAGRVTNARIAFGAMGPTPLRAKAAEQALEGSNLEASAIERAVAALENDLHPADDPIASAWYRREVAPVHLKRLLSERQR
ncbi:MAG: FAD binding domain-containing protein [Pseudomonadota bacterium]